MKFYKRILPAALVLVAVFFTPACESTYYRPKLASVKRFVVYRSPQQMVPFRLTKAIAPASSSQTAGIPSPKAKSQLRPLPSVDKLDGQPDPSSAAEAVNAIITAHQAEKVNEDFALNAVETYDYEAGAVYPVVTSPGFVTVVELQPGESIMNVAGGDTVNWLIDTIDGGHDAQVRTHVLIKPKRPFLQTNVIVTTDRRTYHLTVSSLDSSTYHTAVNWNYALDALVLRRKTTREVAEAVKRTRLLGGGSQPNVNYGYFILTQEKPMRPVWTPLRVYDDGRQVTIEFPAESRHFARPVLFSRSSSGQLHIINYRIEGDRCISQTLFQEAELRLGGSVVRISRAGFRYYAQPPQLVNAPGR